MAEDVKQMAKGPGTLKDTDKQQQEHVTSQREQWTPADGENISLSTLNVHTSRFCSLFWLGYILPAVISVVFFHLLVKL